MSRPLVRLAASLLFMACAVPALAQSNLANCKYYTKTQQDFQAGIKYCADCIKDEPDNPEARFYGAWCLAEVGRFSEAWESFHWLMERANDKDKDLQKNAKMAADRVSQYYATHFNEGVKLLQAGDLQKAHDEFEKSTQINPTKSGGFLNLGYTQSQLKDTDGALASFHKAIEIAPDSTAYEYYSMALGQKRDALQQATPPDSAALAKVSAELKNTLLKVVETTPANDAALVQLGEMELGAGEDSLALVHYVKAIELKKDNLDNLQNVAVDFYQKEQFEKAAKAFAIVTDHADTTTDADLWRDAMYDRALALKSLGKNEDALACVQKLIAWNDKDEQYHRLASTLYVALKNTAKAQEEWDRADAIEKAAQTSPGAGK